MVVEFQVKSHSVHCFDRTRLNSVQAVARIRLVTQFRAFVALYVLLVFVKEFPMYYKLPLLFEPQREGGFTVTSPLLPELITEGDSVEDALENVRDALAAVIDAYQETGRTLPPNLVISDPAASVWAETFVAIP